MRIEQYKTLRRAELTKYKRPTEPSPINRELSFLTSVLWLNEKALDENPKIEKFPENNARARTASVEEFSAICAQLDADTKRLMLAYWETPMRKSEPLQLRWSHVDLENDVINLPPAITKAGKARQIPISEVFRFALVELKQKKVRAVSDHVFTNSDGRPVTRDQLRWRWDKACAAAGVTGLWIHDLRGTWCTARIRAGKDRKFVKAISGHATDHVFERYLRPTLEDLRQVVGSQADPKQGRLF
jgi:integrase